MRLWYMVMSTAAATVIGCWYWLTEPLARLGVDMTLTRLAIIAMMLMIFAAIAGEETSEAVSARRQANRTLRTRRTQTEAGQLSVAESARGSLSTPRSE